MEDHRDPKFQKKVIGRGAAYIYIETIASLISGYIFWLVVSKITTSEVIGTSASLVSFAGIMAAIATLGIPTGIQRFLGKSFSENKFEDAKIFVITSLLIMGIAIFVSSTIILIAQNWIQNTVGYDFKLIIIFLVLIGSSNITMLFRSVVISSLKTSSLPIIFISSSAAKLVVTVILLMLGTGVTGLTFGFTLNHIISSALLTVLMLRTIFKRVGTGNIAQGFINNSKKIVHASVVNWIPTLVITVGSQLGTIVVFGSQGSNQAGIYFLALIIVTGITSVMNSLFTIALPALSGLRDYRKRFAWQTIRLSTIILLPFSCSLIFYSSEIMGLLGQVYVDGSTSLEILLLSLLPMCIVSGVITLLNSFGNYRFVLIIGLSVSISQTLLYFVLTPVYGGIGAAVAYTVGSMVGCIASVFIAKKIGLMLFWKNLGIIFTVPTALGYILSSLNLNFILGILFTVVISYIILLKIRIVRKSDVQDILNILPQNVSNKITDLIKRFKKQ